MEEEEDKLSIKIKFGFGVGRIFNNLCDVMVNTYMLKFYHSVIKLEGTNAGLIMLVGKIAGGLSTFIVGMMSGGDNVCWMYKSFGKRKVLLH